MADPRLFRLRVSYAKQGRLALLSHLEVARALERAVRRSGLPFAVTNGFSPHMRIAFGAALPVGVGGTEEVFDLFLTGYVPDAEALERLADASPADLRPHAARYVEYGAPAASVAFPCSTYEAVFAEDVDALEVPEAIEVVRKKKRKEIAVADHLVGDVQVEGPRATFTLVALPTGSLRPDAFLSGCAERTENVHGQALPPLVSLTRIDQKEGLLSDAVLL